MNTNQCKISFFCVATEPLKNQYPIKESIHSILPIADEIIIIFGRYEKESDEYFKNINNNKIKIYYTNNWPIDWSYDVMTNHFQFGLEKCSGDIIIKFDIDHIYYPNNLRNALTKNLHKNHLIWIPKYNYINKEHFLCIKNGTYCINKYLLDKDNINFNIGRVKYVNSIIIHGEFNQCNLEGTEHGFVNYDCTFMDINTFIEKQYRWFKAYYKLFGNLDNFNIQLNNIEDQNQKPNHNEILKFVTTRLESRIKWAKKKGVLFKLGYEFNPTQIKEKINNINNIQYGYNFFNMIQLHKIL